MGVPEEGDAEIVKQILVEMGLNEKIKVATVGWPEGDHLWPRVL